jgi:hypothetical protein
MNDGSVSRPAARSSVDRWGGRSRTTRSRQQLGSARPGYLNNRRHRPPLVLWTDICISSHGLGGPSAQPTVPVDWRHDAGSTGCDPKQKHQPPPAYHKLETVARPEVFPRPGAVQASLASSIAASASLAPHGEPPMKSGPLVGQRSDTTLPADQERRLSTATSSPSGTLFGLLEIERRRLRGLEQPTREPRFPADSQLTARG